MSGYNTIAKAVKVVNLDLYKWIKRECPNIMNSSKKGTTFLIPDASLNDKIFSDDPITTMNFIRALKLQTMIPTLTKFNADSIVNSLDQSLPDTTRATREGVILANGSTITELPVQPPQGSNFKCYLLSRELIPTDSPDVIDDDDEDERPKPVVQYNVIDRVGYGKHVEKVFLSEFGKNRDEYLVQVSSFMKYLKNNNPDLYFTIIPILSVDPCANFYILFEPYSTTGFHIVDNTTFSSWYDVRGVYTVDCVNFYEQMFNDVDKLDSVLNSSTRKSLIKKLMKMKKTDIQSFSVSSIIKIIRHAYNGVSNGSLHGIKKVYPATTAKLLTPELKMAHDEFRTVISPRIYQCKDTNNKRKFKEMSRLLNIMYSFSHPEKQLSIINPDQIENNIDPYAFVEGTIKPFLRSTYYCSIPTAMGDYKDLMAKMSYSDIDDNTSDTLYESETQIWDRIRKLKYKDNTNHLIFLTPQSKKQDIVSDPVDDIPN